MSGIIHGNSGHEEYHTDMIFYCIGLLPMKNPP